MNVTLLQVAQPLAYTKYRIFCDACFSLPQEIAIGVSVYREDDLVISTGKIVGLKRKHSQRSTLNSHYAEGLAILTGLATARDVFQDFPYSKVTVFSDDLQLVRMLNGASPHSRILHGMGERKTLAKTYESLKNSKWVRIEWASRDTNGIRLSDWMARQVIRRHL